jgi:LuxR family transcriptional regulator, maltose regulon positive regulatory protein
MLGPIRGLTQHPMRSATALSTPPAAPVGRRARRGLRDVSDALRPSLDAKRRRPPFHAGLVARKRLVARLVDAGDAPLALVVAPAGYGKTTVLAEWAEEDGRPFAWVALDRGDNDGASLLASVALALDEIEPLGSDSFTALCPGEPVLSDLALRRLGRCVAARRRPFVLVLDDVHHLDAPAPMAVLEAIIDHLPRGSQLALASRTEPDLPVGRLRVHRRVVELRSRDLAMTGAEAALLLSGLELRAADVDVLVRRTEGWPAGLYLAALSLQDQPDRARAPVRFAGDDRLVADYLRDELLAGLPRERLRFLTRTSVLDHLSGPLCDAVLAGAGSGGTLRELARSNLMLVPLDRADGRYRYHGLFAQMLQAELRRLEPEYEAEVHRRASAWHAGRGDAERAVHHAIAAGDVRSAGDLVWRVAPYYATSGRGAKLRSWLDRFTPEQIAEHAPLALTAATSELATGDRDRLEHWAAAAERRLAGDLSGGAASSAVITVLRALVARDGLARMGEAAARADHLVAGDLPWRALCSLLQGVAAHLTGDREGARGHLEEGARRGAVAAPSIQVLCLAQLGVLALEEDDWDTGEVCISRARRQVERVGLGDDRASALVLAASALARAHRGRVDEARRDLRAGLRLLGRPAELSPWYDAEARVLLARAAVRLGDVVAARTLLAEATRLARGLHDAVVLSRWLEEAWAHVDSFSTAVLVGPSSLTTAELRVLRLLPTHLSFREIAGRLHVSTNTIKTQAHAVYRKLDASSRTEAVANARRVGLVDA